MRQTKALAALVLALLFLSACGPKEETTVTPTPLPSPTQETQTAAPTLSPMPTPSPSPTPTPEYTNYTLTDLGEDSGETWLRYPVLLQNDKILTLDGRAVDYPPGGLIGGTSIDTKGEYCQLFLSAGGTVEKTLPDLLEYAGGQAYNGGWYRYNEGLCPRQDGANGRWGYVDSEGQWVLPPQWTRAGSFSHGQAIVWTGDEPGVIDAAGKLLFSVRAGQDLTAGYVSPDSDAPMRYRWDKWMNGGCGWLDDNGNAVPGPGRDPYTDPNAYYQNGYFTDNQTYYDLSGQPCSETFDWCGPLTADGRGFVGLSGRVYRIEFTQ